MTTSYRSILFDLDGTLTDPKTGITKSIQYALEKLGIAESDPGKLTRFIGPPLIPSFMTYYGMDEAGAQKALALYREYFSVTGIYENEVYLGIPRLLATLKESGRRIYLATSKPTVYAQRILEHFGLAGYFDGVVGSELDGRRVRKAEVIRYVFDHMEAGEKREAVMVGDREHDVIGAVENGIEAIGVLYGYGEREELEKVGAAAIVGSVEELGRILLGWI